MTINIMLAAALTLTPNYVIHLRVFERGAELAAASQICPQHGYTVDRAAIAAWPREAIEEAVLDGVPLWWAKARMQQALRDQADAIEYLGAERWAMKCREIAADPISGRYMR